MFIKRDDDLDLTDDFRSNVKKKLDPHQTTNTVKIDGKVAGWMVSKPTELKVMVISKAEMDANDHVDILFDYFKSPLSLLTHRVGLEESTIQDRITKDSVTVLYAPDPDNLGTVDDFISIYMQGKGSNVRLLYNVNSVLHEMVGVSPQVIKLD